MQQAFVPKYILGWGVLISWHLISYTTSHNLLAFGKDYRRWRLNPEIHDQITWKLTASGEYTIRLA